MLENSELKKAYSYLKFLKDCCNTDVKSYDLKRIIQDTAATAKSLSRACWENRSPEDDDLSPWAIEMPFAKANPRRGYLLHSATNAIKNANAIALAATSTDTNATTVGTGTGVGGEETHTSHHKDAIKTVAKCGKHTTSIKVENATNCLVASNEMDETSAIAACEIASLSLNAGFSNFERKEKPLLCSMHTFASSETVSSKGSCYSSNWTDAKASTGREAVIRGNAASKESRTKYEADEWEKIANATNEITAISTLVCGTSTATNKAMTTIAQTATPTSGKAAGTATTATPTATYRAPTATSGKATATNEIATATITSTSQIATTPGTTLIAQATAGTATATSGKSTVTAGTTTSIAQAAAATSATTASTSVTTTATALSWQTIMNQALSSLELKEKLKVCSPLFQSHGWSGPDVEKVESFATALKFVHKTTGQIYRMIESKNEQQVMNLLTMAEVCMDKRVLALT